MGTVRDLVENERKIITDKAAVEGDVIGVNQTWVDETTNRLSDTIYTNTNEKPIMVSVSGNRESYSYVIFYVDEISICTNSSRDSDTATSVGAVTLIVPSGSTYRVVFQSGVDNGAFTKWFELK